MHIRKRSEKYVIKKIDSIYLIRYLALTQARYKKNAHTQVKWRGEEECEESEKKSVERCIMVSKHYSLSGSIRATIVGTFGVFRVRSPSACIGSR